jgi:hypothetical protein
VGLVHIGKNVFVHLMEDIFAQERDGLGLITHWDSKGFGSVHLEAGGRNSDGNIGQYFQRLAKKIFVSVEKRGNVGLLCPVRVMQVPPLHKVEEVSRHLLGAGQDDPPFASVGIPLEHFNTLPPFIYHPSWIVHQCLAQERGREKEKGGKERKEDGYN